MDIILHQESLNVLFGIVNTVSKEVEESTKDRPKIVVPAVKPTGQESKKGEIISHKQCRLKIFLNC